MHEVADISLLKMKPSFMASVWKKHEHPQNSRKSGICSSSEMLAKLVYKDAYHWSYFGLVMLACSLATKAIALVDLLLFFPIVGF